jgi:hypothetical protein
VRVSGLESTLAGTSISVSVDSKDS